MKRNLLLLLISTLTLPSVADQSPANKTTTKADLSASLRPFWKGNTIEGESLFFIREEGRATATASLYFAPEKIAAMRSANGERTFEVGKDFTWKPGTRELALTATSRIPSKTRAEMYPAPGAPNSIGTAVGGKGNLFFDNGHLFHDLQVEVIYTHRDKWDGAIPQFAGKDLARSLAKLKSKKDFKLVVLGDSISEGYNASKFTKTKPFQPAYPGLVAAQLEKQFGAKVTMINFSVGGMDSVWGVSQTGKVAAEKPDLVILAFGMNDASGRRAPEDFARLAKTMMDAVSKDVPDADFILVATMTGNPDWIHSAADLYPKYRDELKKLCGNGVALADVTSLWQDILKRKKTADINGNGVNHPNDFGHRLYAEVILQLLVVK